MSTLLNEQVQYVSNAGIPMVGGKVYIGDVGADPVLNPQTIYSDQKLTTTLANPQTIDATGRPTNKIWVDGKYSMQVNDINGVQVFQDLDRGTDTLDVDITALSNVAGNNTITATTVDVITSYVDKSIYIFTAVQANTSATTLNIDGVGAKAVVKNNDLPLADGDIKEDDNVFVSYNSTNNNFSILNQRTKVVDDALPVLGGFLDTDGNMIKWSKATIASAPALTLPVTGNVFEVSGTTDISSILGIGVDGTTAILIFQDVLTLTNSSTFKVQGGADYTTVAGDMAIVTQTNSVPTWTLAIIKFNGLPLIPWGIDTQDFASSGTWTKPSDVTSASRTFVWGWGGGGGGTSLVNAGGGGGGYIEQWFLTSDLGAIEAVSIGAGGAAGATTAIAGGITSFGAHMDAEGGNGASYVGGKGGGWKGGAGGNAAGGTTSSSIWGGGGGGDATFDGANAHNAGGGGGGSGGTGGSSIMGGDGGGGGVSGTGPGGGGGSSSAGGDGSLHTITFL